MKPQLLFDVIKFLNNNKPYLENNHLLSVYRKLDNEFFRRQTPGLGEIGVDIVEFLYTEFGLENIVKYCHEIVPCYCCYGNEKILSTSVPEGTKIIGDFAFAGCEGLVAVKLPSTVQEIHHCAFLDDRRLVSINLPEGLNYIGNAAFINCKLKEITIPQSIDTIAEEAFSWCEDLELIKIPERFKSNMENIFSNVNLNDVKEIIYY